MTIKQEHLEVLFDYLIHNKNDYAIQQDDGKYYRAKEPLTEDVLIQHLNGEITIATYPINPEDQTVKYVVIDCDFKGGLNKLIDIDQKLYDKFNIYSAIEDSRRGGHLWIFFEKPILAADARKFIIYCLKEIDENPKDYEINPKQDSIREGSVGNCIRLPLGIHLKSGKRYRFITDKEKPTPKEKNYLQYIKEEIKDLENTELFPLTNIDEILKKIPKKRIIKSDKPIEKDHRINLNESKLYKGLNLLYENNWVTKENDINYNGPCPACKDKGADSTDDHLGIKKDDKEVFNCFNGCTSKEIKIAIDTQIEELINLQIQKLTDTEINKSKLTSILQHIALINCESKQLELIEKIAEKTKLKQADLLEEVKHFEPKPFYLNTKENLNEINPTQYFDEDLGLFLANINNDLIIIDNKKTIKPLNNYKKIPLEALNPNELSFIKNRWSLHSISNYRNGHSIDSLELINKIYNLFYDYIYLPNELDYLLLTYWTVGTYLANLFEAYPYIHLNGKKDSGKSTIQKITNYIAFNSLTSSNITPAVIFRLANTAIYTLLYDEAERDNISNNSDFQSILNGRYRKGTPAHRADKIKGDYKINHYDIYGPSMFASISSYNDTLSSRSIKVNTETAPLDNTYPIVKDNSEEWDNIRGDLYINALQIYKEVLHNYETIDIEGLRNRNKELFSPILAIAKTISEEDYNNLETLTFQKIEESDNGGKVKEKIAVIKALKEIVTKDGYYKVGDITSLSNEYCNELGIEKLEARKTGSILQQLKFTKRSKKSTGYHYYIQKSDVNRLYKKLC